MTRYFILSILFLSMLTLQPGIAKTAGNSVLTGTENLSDDSKMSTADQATGKALPVFPGTNQEKSHGTKATAPHMEELPHIHRFHKERVKKIRQHHGKFWLLSKILVVLCHISILVIAYLHATH